MAVDQSYFDHVTTSHTVTGIIGTTTYFSRKYDKLNSQPLQYQLPSYAPKAKLIHHLVSPSVGTFNHLVLISP